MKTLCVFKQASDTDFFVAIFDGEEKHNLAGGGTYTDGVNAALDIWGLDKGEVIIEVDGEITFTYDSGLYGIHDGFFNAVVILDNRPYYFQCCTDENGRVDIDNCGHDEGQCADTNQELAYIIGWNGVLHILSKAYKQYE